MKIRFLDYAVAILALTVLFAATLGFSQSQNALNGSSVSTGLKPCIQYDMSRGEDIANAYDEYMMETPEKSKPEVLRLMAETPSGRRMEGDLETLAERLASDLEAQAKYKDAIDVWQSLLQGKEKTLGEKSIGLVDTLYSLANTYRKNKDYTQAEKALVRVLEITEGFHGPADYESAICFDKLAALKLEQKNYPAAENYMMQALDIRRSIYGSSSEFMIESYVNLAVVATKVGDKAKAIDYYSTALKIADQHPAGSEARELRARLRALCKDK